MEQATMGQCRVYLQVELENGHMPPKYYRAFSEYLSLADQQQVSVEPEVKVANGITITDVKQGQNTVKIYGHEWYDNGIWKLEIFDPLDELIFEYKINDNDSDKDYTFEEFIEEAMQKYNASRLSV